MTTMIRTIDPERYNRLIERRPMLDTGDTIRTLSLADWLRERQARRRDRRPEIRDQGPNVEIVKSLTDRCLAYLASNPPATARTIADALGVDRHLITASMFRATNRGAVVSTKIELPGGRASSEYSLPNGGGV